MSTFNTINIAVPVNTPKQATAVAITGTGRTMRADVGLNSFLGVCLVTNGGSAVVANKNITANSIILLTPSLNAGVGVTGFVCYENRAARAVGATFKVMLKTDAGSAMTGRVFYQIWN